MHKESGPISLGLDKIRYKEAEDTDQTRDLSSAFFEVSREGLDELRLRIKKNNGVIRVFVHPFFYQYQKKYAPKAKRPEYNLHRLAEIKQSIKVLLKKSLDATPPVFIFEEAERLDETKQIINDRTNPGNNAYFVPTQTQSAEPIFKGKSNVWEDNWEKLRKIFRDLGVKTVIIGGQYLKVVHGYDLDPDMFEYRKQRRAKGAKNMEYDLEKCVRGVVSNLSQDEHLKPVFNVEVSNFTFPDSRRDTLDMERRSTYADLYHKSPTKTT